MYLTVFFKDRNKLRRRQETVLCIFTLIFPLRQRLISAELSVLGPAYGLIIDLYVTPVDRSVDVIDYILTHLELLIEDRIVFTIILIKVLLDRVACITGSVTGDRRILVAARNLVSAGLKSRLCIKFKFVDIRTEIGKSLLKIFFITKYYKVIVALTAYEPVVEFIYHLTCKLPYECISGFKTVLLVDGTEILDIKIYKHLTQVMRLLIL